MTNRKTTENEGGFICDKCNFKCSNNCDYIRHISTAKHKRLTYANKNANKKTTKNDKSFDCNCGNSYKHRSSLSKHKRTCSLIQNSVVIVENPEEKPSMLDFITQNKEIMDLLVAQNKEIVMQNKEQAILIKEQADTIRELIPKIGNNNTTNNNNTNQFNLQVFLNEDCKDALNFSDFIKQIQVTFEDLENQAESGYVKGISKLFIENLKELGTHKRPIHCTDKKRKTLYIKENDEWDKEGSQNTLKKGIQDVSKKTMSCLSQEKEENIEEYDDIESDFSQKYLLIKRNLLPDFPQETTINNVIEQISKNSGIND